ncbi:MAG: EF-P lysine aminoacylase GenX [Myxococcales bacterium]|nr:EF-P lysine aminoacylase GenX [Myxococcales bacterium]
MASQRAQSGQRPVDLRRVLACDGVTAWLFGAGRVDAMAVAPGHEPLWQPGDWLDLSGGHPRRLGRAHEPRQFPHPDGDFARLSAGHGRAWLGVRARAVLLRAIRAFFDQRGFVEVDPPTLAACPGLELHLDAVRAELREGMGGAPVTRWLTTSPEYHCKRLLSAGFSRIYSLGHVFRSGERGTHHNPEFSMLEWYRAGAPWTAIVRDTRALVRHCARRLETAPELAALWQVPARRPRLDVEAPWQRMSVRAALREFAGFDPGRMDDAGYVERRARTAGLEVRAGDGVRDILTRALAERVEPALVARSEPPESAAQFVVLAPFPACMASLARTVPGRPWLAERFEVYAGGVELANGFGELTDPHEQRARFEADLAERRRTGRPEYPIDDRFLRALHDGCPQAAGVALGVDRLLMALTGLNDIADVLPFPFELA